jgi:hypothetical protein
MRRKWLALLVLHKPPPLALGPMKIVVKKRIINNEIS